MLKKFTLLFCVLFIAAFFISFRTPFFSSVPPSDHTGATSQTQTCRNCHGSAAGGGSVTVAGLPTNYVAGQTYNFSVTISHSANDRQKWGFQLAARNANNSGIGTFSTGPNTTLTNGTHEISHNGAVVTGPSGSYTYTGMSWTAPTNPGVNDNSVTFHLIGNAANGDFGTSGDFIYSNSVIAILPVELKEFKYKIIDGINVQIQWQTVSENNSREFVVERSDNNSSFYEVGKVPASGNSSSIKTYTYTDNQPSSFNKPVFYRLKLVDIDGKFKYSKTIQLSLKGKPLYITQLSPNPVQNDFKLHVYSNATAQSEITISDVKGSVLFRIPLQLQKGLNTKPIIVDKLAHGRYFLKLQTKDYIQAISFMKL